MAGFQKKAVTIADVARAAGVSKATVSRYINGKRHLISAAAQARIQAVIDVTDYNPNSIAQSLRTKQSYQVGVIMGDITSPFSTALMRGINAELLPAGYVPLFMDSRDSLELEMRFIKILMARKIDGLMVNTSDCRNPALIQLACQGFPVVLCDRRVNDYNFAYVGCDHAKPVMDLMDHLKAEGFHTVAFFTQEYAHNSSRSLRLNAYRRKMAELYPEENVDSLIRIIDLKDTSGSAAAVREVLGRCAPGQVPAIITSNSITGMHLLSVMMELGVSIPKDCGFCCPDDFGWGDSINWPTLGGGITTLSVHPSQIGEEAARLLLRMLLDENTEKTEILLPTELTIRNSTRLR